MRLFRSLWAGGLVAMMLALPAEASEKKAKPPETCGSFGTSVTFEKSPTAAARRAQKEGKLVLVLHVSGNFEDSEFT